MAGKKKKYIVKNDAWLTLVYPDSVLKGWRQELAEIGIRAIISPVHDSDFKEDGSPDKPHRHVMLLWDGPTTENRAKEIIELIHGVGIKKCASKCGSARYFLHLDEPNKAKYDIKDMEIIGSVDLQKYLVSEDDEQIMLKEIYCFIRENDCESYKDFIDYCIDVRDDWFRLVTKKYRENIWRYIRSLEYDNKKEYKNGNGSTKESK